MSPDGTAEQSRQIDDAWFMGFNQTHEILCLAAVARKFDFEPCKDLANAAYGFWKGTADPKETETELKRLFAPGIGALYSLKRVLMVEIANAGPTDSQEAKHQR
jgi:hypothetical protein